MKTQNLKKNSRKLRNLMLLTSLCAILSCSSNDRTFIADSTPTDPKDPSIIIPVPSKPTDPSNPTDPSKPIDPSNPTDPSKPIDPSKPDPEKPPVVDASSRFTTTPDITKLKEGIYDSPKYEQKNGSNDSNNGSSTTINAMEYGLKSEFQTSTSLSILPLTEMIVEKDGAAFMLDVNATVDKNAIKRSIFSNDITNANNLKLTMKEGSYFLILRNADIKLSKSDFSNILSGISDHLPTINGTGYNEIKFINSWLRIDESVNLDVENNKYFKTASDLKPIEITLNKNKSLTGTKDGQVAIKARDEATNEGTIKLTGKNTVALFSKKGIYNRNDASIEVGEDSIGQYVIYDVRV